MNWIHLEQDFGNNDTRSGNNFESCCKSSACYAISLPLRNKMYEKENRGEFFWQLYDVRAAFTRSLESRFYYSGFEIARVPIDHKEIVDYATSNYYTVARCV